MSLVVKGPVGLLDQKLFVLILIFTSCASAIKNSGRDGKGEGRFMHPDEDTMILMYGLTGDQQKQWRKTVIDLREYFINLKKKKKP